MTDLRPGQLRRASVNQIEIAYDDFGGVADENRPLVLVHGLTGHRADWDARQAELSSLGRCIAPDLRGHGDSTNTGDAGSYRFAQLVEVCACSYARWVVRSSAYLRWYEVEAARMVNRSTWGR